MNSTRTPRHRADDRPTYAPLVPASHTAGMYAPSTGLDVAPMHYSFGAGAL